jgi:hypothetical protein
MQATILQNPVQKAAATVNAVSSRKIRSRYLSVLSLLGWTQLPISLLSVLSSDLDLWKMELEQGYMTTDQQTIKSRARIRYWVNAYTQGLCSLRTAIEMLSPIGR